MVGADSAESIAASSTVGAARCAGTCWWAGATAREGARRSLSNVVCAPESARVSFGGGQSRASSKRGLWGSRGPVVSPRLAQQRTNAEKHRQRAEVLAVQCDAVTAGVLAEECVTYRSPVRDCCGRQELLVMCSSPGAARSWCAQAVECVNSCPMLRAAGVRRVCDGCDAAGVRCAVDGARRGGRSKTVLALGRSRAPRAGTGTGLAQAGRQQREQKRVRAGAGGAGCRA
jgi:hypothetical protein